MGKTACCDKRGLKKGSWTPEEDQILISYINKHGHGRWRSLPKLAGLLRCGKSCRLRWTNYLRPDIKRGPFSSEEEKLVIQLHGILGNSEGMREGDLLLQKIAGCLQRLTIIFCARWAAIAAQLPGRTDNEVKNLWNTHLKKRLLCMGLDPQTHEPFFTSCGPSTKAPASPSTRHMAQWESARLEAEARLSRESLLFNPQPVDKTDSDYFLKLWNSEVGESFRRFNPGSKTACQSPVSQACSTKCGSVSSLTTEMSPTIAGCSTMPSNRNEDVECKSYKSYSEDVVVGSDSSSSSELEDSSDMALQLLLDFPDNNDMSFLG